VTNFYLDGFQAKQLERLILKVAENTTTEAAWLLADFREPEYGWRNIS
jgi:hypothetical protein